MCEYVVGVCVSAGPGVGVFSHPLIQRGVIL